MANALGSSTARPQHGANWYDIRDFGALPNDSSSDSMGRTSVDRAWDAILAALPPKVGSNVPPCTIFFPGGTWTHNDPLLADRDNLTIRGDGRDTTRIAPVFSKACTSIQLGLRRAPDNPNSGTNPSNGRPWITPAILGPEHWVDLYGKMDTTLAPFAASRWGFRTNGDSHLTFHSSPWNCGNYDYFGATNQLTFDFCLDGRGAVVAGTNTSLIGLADPLFGPNPFAVALLGNNTFLVEFRTADQTGPTPSWRNFSYTVPASQTGVQKHAVQLDLANAQVSVFVGGVQVATNAVTVSSRGGPSAAWAAASNLTFRANPCQPFNIGSFAIDQFNSYNEGGQGTIPDISLYGMKLSKGLRYQVNGVGTPQLTTASVAATDKYRYAVDGSTSMIVCLTLDDPPGNSPNARYAGRLVHWTSNGTRGNGWFMSTNTQGGYNGWVVNPVVRDLTVVGQQPWGDGISIGGVINLAQVKDVSVEGGFFRSVGSLAMGSSYPIEVTGCRLDNAFDAAYQGDSQIINRLEFTSNQMGTVGLRLRGCELKSSNIYFGGQQTFNGYRPPGGAISDLVYLHAGQYGATYCLTFSFDGEDPSVPTHSHLTCENHFALTTLALRDCKFASQASSGLAAVVLRDQNDGTSSLTTPLRVLAQGCTSAASSGTEPKSFFLTDGPLARGTVQDCQAPNPANCQHVKNTGPGGVGNIVWRYTGDYSAHPTTGTWTAGAHVLENPTATNGQWKRSECVQSGTYGTSTPPLWQDFDLVNTSTATP